MEERILQFLMQASAEVASTMALIEMGKIKPFLKKSEASRQYGRKNVETWIRKNLLTIRKDGNHSSSLRIDRIELLIIKLNEEYQNEIKSALIH